MLNVITKVILLLIIDISLNQTLQYRTELDWIWRTIIIVITNFLVLILVNLNP